MAVNILFIEPIRNRVSIVFGARCSRSAKPYAWSNTVLPRAVTSTAPAKRSAAASRSSVSRSALVSCLRSDVEAGIRRDAEWRGAAFCSI